MTRASAPRAERRRAVPTAIDEFAATLSGEIARCAARATEHAMLLAGLGMQSFEATAEISRGASSTELRQLSYKFRGLVVHALGVLADLQCIAGRLDAFAALRAVAPELDGTDDSAG